MAFTLVQHTNSLAYKTADAAGNLSVSFLVVVGSGNNVKGWCQWGTASAADLVSVSDDKLNTYAISDKILGTTNGQSLGAFHAENLTNAPVTITVKYTANTINCSILIEEWSGEDSSGTALNAHGGQRQADPATTTDAVSSGNITTNVDGCNICGTAADVAGTSTALAVGTGYVLADNYYVDVKEISESKTQTTQGAVAATFTMTTAANETLAIAVAFSPPGGAGATGVGPANIVSSAGRFLGWTL
jgi:hypothetical protein